MNNYIIQDAIEYYDKNNLDLKFKIKNYNIIFDTDTRIPTIQFFDINKKLLLESKFQLISIYYKKTKLWVWSWGHNSLKKNQIMLSRKLLNYGLDISINDSYHE